MAATSTNKQPLLVDHVLHVVRNTDQSINNGLDIIGTNTATLLVDSTAADGAIIEDVYTIARGTTGYIVNLYLSTARDYLRPNEAYYIGAVPSDTNIGGVLRWIDMPKTLTPVPQVGTEPYNRALYVPKGYALWAARDSALNVTDAPLIGVQGGWF